MKKQVYISPVTETQSMNAAQAILTISGTSGVDNLNVGSGSTDEEGRVREYEDDDMDW